MAPLWIHPKLDPLNWVAPSFDFIRIPPDIQMADPLFRQDNIRWRDDSTALNTDGGWLAAENSGPDSFPPGVGWVPGIANRRRLRISVDETNSKTGSFDFQLEYELNNDGNWFDVTTTSSVIRATGGLPTQGDACSTQLLSAPPIGSFQNGTYSDTGLCDTYSNAKDDFAEFEYCIYAVEADVANGEFVNLRIKGLDVYSPEAGAIFDKQLVEIYSWQFVRDDDVEASASSFPRNTENEKLDVGPASQHDIATDTNFRLRIGIKAKAGRTPGSSTVQLISARLPGPPVNVNASSSMIRMSASPHFASGDPTTDHGLTAPGGGFTFVAGEMDETDGLTGAVELSATQYTILEFCLTMRDVDVTGGEKGWAFGVVFGGINTIVPADEDTPQNNEKWLHYTVLSLHGRFRDDDGDESSTGASFLAAQDVGLEVGSGLDVEFDTNFRLRALLEDAGGGHIIFGLANFTYLYFSVNGGEWEGAGDSGTTTKYIVCALSPNVADLESTTDHGMTVSATGSFSVGDVMELDWSSGSLDHPGADGYMIFEWSLQALAAQWTEGDVITFMVRSDWGTPLNGTSFRKLPESFSLTMPASGPGPVPVAATDGLELGDSATVKHIGRKFVAADDGLDLGDSADVRAIYLLPAADGLDLGDVGAAPVRAPGAGSEGLELGDSADVAVVTGTFVDGSDGLDFGDDGVADLRMQALGVDGLEVSDIAAVGIRTPAPAADGLELGDSASVAVVGPPPPGFSSLRVLFG